MPNCTHLSQIKEDIAPHSEGCEDCEKAGDSWVAVRLCLSCGHTGCCDSSKSTHARKHFKETGHPIIDSFSPRGSWKWCYLDDDYV